MATRGAGSAPAVADRFARLPLVALVSSLVVGPLGAGLGVWAVVRSRRAGRPNPALAVAAIVLGIVQTVGITVWAVSRGSVPQSGPTPAVSTTAWTYPTTPPPSGPANPPSQTPTRPQPTSIEQVVPPKVERYQATSFSPAPSTVHQGAVAAKTGSYTNARDTIGAAFSQWPTAEAAARHAREAGIADYGADALRTSGNVSCGAYWYYELNGVGTVYWSQGTISASFTGKPYEVQEFFLSFPK